MKRVATTGYDIRKNARRIGTLAELKARRKSDVGSSYDCAGKTIIYEGNAKLLGEDARPRVERAAPLRCGGVGGGQGTSIVLRAIL